MVDRIVIKKILLRKDESYDWIASNAILEDGEMGLERDTRQFKIGDGVTPWNLLEYGGLTGPPGPVGFISTDNDNRLTHGTDGGLHVPDLTLDLVELYEQYKI